MAAKLALYEDEACTTEISFKKSSYYCTLGPANGLNGDDGISYDKVIYVKNVGDTIARSIIIAEHGDNSELFKINTDLESSADTQANIGSIKPGEVSKVVLSSVITQGTAATDDYIQYVISFWTAPRTPVDQETVAYTAEELIEYYSGSTKNPDAIAHLYGYGPYGDPLYGQEGLLHKTTVIDGDLPIAGMGYTYLYANYSIVCRFNGTEINVEDIQCCYTDRYMRLGCLDGPALPFWTTQSNDQDLT